MGGLLIGIGLAVHLVFPASVGFGMELGNSFVPAPLTHAIPDPGTPPGSGVVCNPVISGLYGLGEDRGPALICIPVCLLLSLIPGVTYPFCYGKSQSPAPADPTGFGCTGIGSFLWWAAQLAFPLVMSPTLSNSPMALTPDSASLIYKDLAFGDGGALQTIVALNLAVLILAVLMLTCTVLLARGFGQTLGGEGQFYGLAKLV
jgi:hypothetical protein